VMKANQNKKEEIANAITHGLGAALAIAALVLLVVFSVIKGNTWHVVSFSIFGASLVILYLASTLYHSFSNPRVKAFFKKLDHMSIFVLIAGTYTPFCIAVLQNWIGWTFFGIVWGCTILGIVIKAFHTGKKEVLSTILYVLMGWIIVFAIKPLYNAISFQAFLFLIIGGILYSVGTFFFINNKIKYNHSIWHLFVLGGSTFHFFSVMSLLA
jgi:hemolysin III